MRREGRQAPPESLASPAPPHSLLRHDPPMNVSLSLLRNGPLGWMLTMALLLSFVRPSHVVAADEPAAAPRPSDEQVRFFETTIRPLLANHCYDCHGEETQESELRLDSFAGMRRGGKAGPALIPGKPEGSLIVTAVSYRDNDLKMPPDGKLTDKQIADLTAWVKMGAPHPDSGNVEALQTRSRVDLAEGRAHWAFRPLNKPPTPAVADAAHVRNPIDAFLQSALEARGLSPLGPADKRLLIRRATFDLIGLPPTPEEIDAFLADDSADAFEKVVDRLLESPHYGERWGRHWLDIARYADSNGLDENVAHGNAWRYRDYVFRAFNDDKPYDEFLVEQIAGDLLDSGDDLDRKHERLIATGFLVLGPKVLAEVDSAKMEMDIIDEQLDTIGRSLLGLTLGCARCHDHKFDPIGQDDYYALAGIFKSTRVMETYKIVARWNENTIATPEELARKTQHEQLIADKKQEIETQLAQAKSLLPPPNGETVPADVEQQFPEETRTRLQTLRAELKQLESSLPVLPSAMGVVDGSVADVAIHVRGSHLTLGEVVPRRFPLVMTGEAQSPLPSDRSGRLEFARWLVGENHPLTARVFANRIWRWHFGKGLVPSVDNFGVRGEAPTHPDLLEWLAARFVEQDWSVKAMHRLIMSSVAYQRGSRHDPVNAGADPDNRLYWRYDMQRLDAESLRDALLSVSGTLDRTMGGNLLAVENRAYLFNHTSQDKSSYNDLRRRSVYLPVIRNHLYDFFQLFDYADPSVLDGDRDSSTIAPQALLLMNSELLHELTTAMADRLLTLEDSPRDRIDRLFVETYGRPPAAEETASLLEFLARFESLAVRDAPPEEAARRAWRQLCHSVVTSNEFVYVR